MPESVRLFSFCSAMEFSIMPVAGGVYDQHPKLIEQWDYLFRARADKHKNDKKKPPPRRGR